MNNVEKTILHTPHFLTGRRNVIQFMVYIAIFSIFFGAAYRPVGLIRIEGIMPAWNTPLYISILVLSGLGTLALSRILLNHLQQHFQLKPAVYTIWVAAEIICFAFELTAIGMLINANKDVSFLQLFWHMLLDVVAVLTVPYLVAVLIFVIKEKNQEIEALKAMAQHPLNDKYQADDIINFFEKGGRLAFATKKSNVLYIEASDNYTNIHYINDGELKCFILHNSMKQVEETYTSLGMLRCHRGYLVNLENVKLLRKDKDGLVMELAKCEKVIPVSKTYIDKVSHYFAGIQTSALLQ